MAISIERVMGPTPDARMLITELEVELSAVYAPDQRHGLNLDQLFHPGVSFFIARQEHGAVGCGGVAFADSVAEIKRMYVRPAARGRGVARAILAQLEQETRSRGISLLVLETGDAQHEAIRLYEQAGFRRRAAFGHYAQMLPAAVQRSVFFEKKFALALDG